MASSVKREPSYVKRIRLKQSIIKTNQILQTLSVPQKQLMNVNCMTQQLKQQAGRNLTINNRVSIKDTQIYNSKNVSVSPKNIRHLIKAYNSKNFEHPKILGLDVRRIVANSDVNSPTQRKDKTLRLNPSQRMEIETLECCEQNIFLSQSQGRNHKKLMSIDSSQLNQSLYKDLNGSSLSKQVGQSCQSREINLKSAYKIHTGMASNRKNKLYLYKKLAQQQTLPNNACMNEVYQNRIKSYTDFL